MFPPQKSAWRHLLNTVTTKLRLLGPRNDSKGCFREKSLAHAGIRSEYGKDRIGGPPSLLFNGYQGCFPRVKRPKRDAYHSFPTIARVKNVRRYTSTAPYTPS